MKKYIFVIIGLVVMMTSGTVFAKESILTDWTVNKNNAVEYEVVCDRNETSDGGSNSLRMYVEKSAESGYVELRSVGVTAEKSTAYVLEFDYKSEADKELANTTVYAGSATRNLIAADNRSLSASNEWRRYKAEFTTASNQAVITARIKLSQDKTMLWIDNMSLHKKDSDENVLHNPDMNIEL